MKIKSEVVAVERAPDGLLVQFSGGGVRGALVIEATREIPLVGQALNFEYAVPGGRTGAEPLIDLIPPRGPTASTPDAGSNASAAPPGGSGSSGSGRASDVLLAFMQGGRDVPLTDRDVSSELDAFVGTTEEVQRGLQLQRRR